MLRTSLLFHIGILCLGGMFPRILSAQNTEVIRINELYAQTREKIDQQAIFRCDFRFNLGNHQWNHSTVHNRQESYFYEVSPSQEAHLKLIQIERDSAGHIYQLEFLLDPLGNLIYSRESRPAAEGTYRDMKTYFRGASLSLVLEDDIQIKSSTLFYSQKINYLRQSAAFYQAKFEDYIPRILAP